MSVDMAGITWPVALVTVAVLAYRLVLAWLQVLGARALASKELEEIREEMGRLGKRVNMLEMRED
jgi:hypothetical protein